MKEQPLSDRERILMTVISRLATTQILCGAGWGEEHFWDRHTNSVYAHFAYWKKPVSGDLVLAKTGGVSHWKVGWYVEPLPDGIGGAVIREIGTNNLCNYRNEEFVPIEGIFKADLLEGDKRAMYDKVRAAFAKGDEYIYRFGGVDFEGGDTAIIWVREVFGGLGNHGESVPFSIRMKFNKRTSVKSILQAMRDGGYGTRKFEKKPVAA